MDARRCVVLAALLLAASAPAHAATKPSVSFRVEPDTHRISGSVAEGNRAQVPVGCAIAWVMPLTSDQTEQTVPRGECRVTVGLVISGVVRGASFVGVQAQNLDTDKCWPDISVANVVACNVKTPRSAKGTGTNADRKGRFSIHLDPDQYTAAGIKIEARPVCKPIQFKVVVRAGSTKIPRSITLNPCA